MRVAVGGDHRGYMVRARLLELVKRLGHEVVDVGTHTSDPVDYPDIALRMARKVVDGEVDRGILVCGTGLGMCIAANKVHGIRAALCNDLYTARFARLHNDANVLSIGARVVAPGLAREILGIFLATEFEGGRHIGRLEEIARIERGEL